MMANQNEEHYKELLEAIRPFFPDDPVQAHAVVTEKIGPIFNDVLLHLLWRQLQIEQGHDWIYTVPYQVFENRFSMN